MYPNNGVYPNQFAYGQQPAAYGYGVPRPQARNTQPLTPDQIAKLRQDVNAFDMKVDQEDLWRAACTHKEKNGASTLIQNNDGTYTCTICHETFQMCESSPEEINAAVKTLVDMLQTTKTIYLDIPEDLAAQYFQIIPLIQKFPKLWERAIKNFSMYEGTMNGVSPMSPGYSGFAAIQNLLTNPYAGFNYGQPMTAPQQQPMYGYGMPVQQPMYGYGQPMAAPQMMDPTANPMAYGVPGAATMPAQQAAPAPGVMPGVPQPGPVAAPAPQQAEVQQQQVFNV